MDIFTTVLTRVVPVPIKPTNLKVKALQKSAGASTVSDDIGDVEEHELYFKKPITDKPSEKEEKSAHASTPVVEASPDPTEHTGQLVDIFEDSEISPSEDDDDNTPHLDIFI